MSLGDNVTLRCHLPQPALQVLLYQNEAEIRHRYSTGEQNTAEFVFEAIEWRHMGTYRCQYEDKERKMSALSDPVELLVTGEGDKEVPPGMPRCPGCPHGCPILCPFPAQKSPTLVRGRC